MRVSGNPVKLNDKGITLVELIVAIAIGAIVSGAVAALITFSIRMFNNESVNTQMQYELQSNINSMMDEIMASSAFVVAQNNDVGVNDNDKGAYTQYALFGRPGVIENVGGANKKYFEGVIFVSSAADSKHKFKIYMKRSKVEIGLDDTADLKSIASAEYAAVTATFADDPSPYLLGEYATQFVIKPVTEDGRFDMSKSTYINPIEVKVSLRFEKDGWGTQKYSKHVDDVVYLRNKAEGSLFIQEPGASFTEYKLKKKED